MLEVVLCVVVFALKVSTNFFVFACRRAGTGPRINRAPPPAHTTRLTADTPEA